MPAEQHAGYRPRDLCRRWRVGIEKVLGFIRRGELRALNLAGNRCGPPRYTITAEAVEEFEAGRATTPPPKPARRRKRTEAIIDFYPD